MSSVVKGKLNGYSVSAVKLTASDNELQLTPLGSPLDPYTTVFPGATTL